MPVRPKKHLGQHFLKDRNIARRIVDALGGDPAPPVVEIGPGTGILTALLLEKFGRLTAVEKDAEAVSFLRRNFPDDRLRMVEGDVLRTDFGTFNDGQAFRLIGNLPYNITGPIFFRILENRRLVPLAVVMIQKEVAQRIAAAPGSKTYGILSVLTQLYYETELLFGVPPQVFSPPPKVQSAVIRLRCRDEEPPVDWEGIKKLVKTAFNQRRKTLKNSLKSLNLPAERIPGKWAGLRPEQLSPGDFVELYLKLYRP